jgi:hypothetical protein
MEVKLKNEVHRYGSMLIVKRYFPDKRLNTLRKAIYLVSLPEKCKGQSIERTSAVSHLSVRVHKAEGGHKHFLIIEYTLQIFKEFNRLPHVQNDADFLSHLD